MVKTKNYHILFAAVALVTILLDQATKLLVSLQRPEWELRFLSIHFVQNTGAGFGILKGQMTILAIISAAVAMSIIYYYRKIPQEIWAQLWFGLFLGGVSGNLLDRIFRQYVVDFIDVGFWPVFNVADAAISISVIGLMVYFWRKEK